MNENETLDQKQEPIVQQQVQENNVEANNENLNSEKASAISEKVHLMNKCKTALENSIEKIKANIKITNTDIDNHLSCENQKLDQANNDSCMDADMDSTVLKEQVNDEVQKSENPDESTNEINKNDKNEEMITENLENKENKPLVYNWTAIKLVCSAVNEFKPTEVCENFTKGCHWSPDGTCILVSSEDFKIRIFELPRKLYSGKLPEGFHVPSFESSLKVKEGGIIYDTCWFPYMSSWDPSTCCFLSASQGSPIHLWDAFTGQLRATYRAYNQVDEVEPALSVHFTDAGGRIWSGYKNCLRTFDTDRPGRHISEIYLKKDFPNITGLVSCIRENPGMSGLIAFGTYSKYIGLYKDGPLCSFETSNGVTQIEFSSCGTKLYSTVRRGSEFLCWDLRNPGTVLYSLQNRQSDTNQRIYFSLSYNGEEIVSGGTDGSVRIWKIPNNLQIDEDLHPRYKIQVSKDCVNGVNLHKNLPVLAVSTGSRICDEEKIRDRDNSVRFYWLDSR